MNICVLGYNGERQDPVSGMTHLGNGYRSYNPVLMRFNCPDFMSPHGDGGINSYAYCAGDPINRVDPDGHHSFWGWLGIGMGVALGGLLTPVSVGSSLTVALSIVSVATAVVSIGLAIAQQFVEDSDSKTAAVWGWAALGTGIVSGLSSAMLYHLAPGAKSLAGLLNGTSKRQFGGWMMEGNESTRIRNINTDSIYTNYENMSQARNMPINQGIGNCEHVAKRTFNTLLTGSRPSDIKHAFVSTVETFSGMKNALNNLFNFRRNVNPVEIYEGLFSKISFHGPLPEISIKNFSNLRAMESALNNQPKFSVFWAISKTKNLGMETNHAYIIARGGEGEYSVFDNYSSFTRGRSALGASQYFDSFYREFNVELTGFW